MKYTALTFLLVVCLIALAKAQTSKNSVPKIHAFSKEVLGGAAPKATIDESGSVTEKKASPSYQYYLYLETSRSQVISIRYIWMQGKAYKVKMTKATLPIVVPGTPAVGTAAADTLIAKGKNNFWKLELGGIASGIRPKTSVSNSLKSNAIVAEYFYKGKGYLLSAKEIKKLSPLVLQ